MPTSRLEQTVPKVEKFVGKNVTLTCSHLFKRERDTYVYQWEI